MILARVEDFKGGWFIGNFSPAILQTGDFEVCLKTFRSGDKEPSHYQKSATEVTVVVSGSCRMGSLHLSAGDILVLDAGEMSDFEAIEDCVIVCVKAPSLPDDKALADA
jgi:quercetin dioxygenase-like cupin family protein